MANPQKYLLQLCVYMNNPKNIPVKRHSKATTKSIFGQIRVCIGLGLVVFDTHYRTLTTILVQCVAKKYEFIKVNCPTCLHFALDILSTTYCMLKPNVLGSVVPTLPISLSYGTILAHKKVKQLSTLITIMELIFLTILQKFGSTFR